MPTATIVERISAPASEVFSLLHNYEHRLEWDTLLQSARLDSGFEQAALGVTSVCTSKWYLGGIAMRTKYIAWRPPELAAVELIERNRFFKRFAASIRHEDISKNQSSVTYRLTFEAEIRILQPVMQFVLRLETERRLRALARYFQNRAE